jgi:hypothetical protein
MKKKVQKQYVDLELNLEKIPKGFSWGFPWGKFSVCGRRFGRGNPGGFFLEEIPLVYFYLNLELK